MENITIYILKLNVLASACILIIRCISNRVKAKYSSQWRYTMWLLISLFLLLPMNFNVKNEIIRLELPQESSYTFTGAKVNNSVDSQKPVRNEMAKSSGTVNEEPGIEVNKEVNKKVNKEQSSPSEQSRDNSIDISELLCTVFWVWIIGFLIVSIYRTFAYRYSISGLRRWSLPVKDDDILTLYKRICEENYIKSAPGLMLNSRISSPVLAGLWRVYIYLPDVQYTQEELELILLHELYHYSHKDNWYKLLLLLVNTLYWFNPLLYFIKKEAEKDIEYMCDSRVTSRCCHLERNMYKKLLLKTAANQNSVHYLATSLNDGMKDFKERIDYIQMAPKMKKGIVLMLCCFAFLAFSNILIGVSLKEEKVQQIENLSAKLTGKKEPGVLTEQLAVLVRKGQMPESELEAGNILKDGKYYCDRELNRELNSGELFYYEIDIKNVEEKEFEFNVYERYNSMNDKSLVTSGTGVFRKDGKSAYSDEKSYIFRFSPVDGNSSYTGTAEFQVQGLGILEGKTFTSDQLGSC